MSVIRQYQDGKNIICQRILISLYVYEGGQGEITEKKSRFIATVRPVESEDEAVSFINETKRNTGMQGTTVVPLL